MTCADGTPARRFDVVIVGGGMVGASLALALSGTGLEVMMIESVVPGTGSHQPSFDDRTTALGNASRRIFQALGVWPEMAREAAAIRTIHVSDAGHFGFARLEASEQGIEAFGYVITNRVIGAALWSKLKDARGITVRAPAQATNVEISADDVRLAVTTDAGAKEWISARLIVAADGAHSSVRAAAGIGASVEDYDQVAITTNVATDRPHDGTAYERFTPTGPLALLPLWNGHYGVVWSVAPADATRLLALDDAAFLAELQDRFGWRVGRFMRVGRRASYPLKLTRAVTTVATRAVLIGNAAQALHPVAGQGFNLGLRDAAMLAEVLASTVAPAPEAASAAPTAAAPGAARVDPGSATVLARFEQWRAGDRLGVTRFTDGLIKLFGDTRPGMSLVRNFGLLLFDLTPPAKSALARVSAGFAGPTPRLARGLAVR